MGKLLMTVDWPGDGKPSLKQVADHLKIEVRNIDAGYGLVLIDPEKNAYAFQVDEEAASGIKSGIKGVRGPFSDPKIEPFDIDPGLT